MKTIINYINERLNISSDLDIKKNKDIVRRFMPPSENDEWTKECYNALVDEFGSQYNVEHHNSGIIYFYYKGKKQSLKNLVCAVYGTNDIDFGPNDKLESTLGKKILDVINSIK